MVSPADAFGTIIIVFLSTSILCWLECVESFQEIKVETCSDEIFEARCQYSQKILISNAKYGHIEVSKCVSQVFGTLGLLGCYANITDTIGPRCNKKSHCEIDGDDKEVLATKSCDKGLPMYMDITYVCVPEVNVQTCSDEVFEARCQYSQKILITQAKFGHIEVSRCVSEVFSTLNTLGCYANITNTIGSRCNEKSFCEILGDDPEVLATKSCHKGLGMYLDTTHVCLPETQVVPNCDTVISSRQIKYVTTKELWDNNCFHDLDQSVNIDIKSSPNLKLKISLELVSTFGSTTDENAQASLIASDGSSREIEFINSRAVFESEDSHSTLLFPNRQQLILIGYQAFGCDDLEEPPYAWTTRNGDKTMIGCHHTDHEWTVTCIGSKWFGSKGNCTQKAQEIIVPTPPPERNIDVPKRKQTWTPDILFALIIGITVLLCAIVMTVGYVCLKRAKYTYASKSGPYEMSTLLSDPSNTATWQKAKLQGNNDTLILPMNPGTMQSQTLQLR